MTRRNFLQAILTVSAAVFPAAARVLLDINSASIGELTMLPGIGEAKAREIVKNRPYSNKAQLLTRKILSAAEYRGIRDLIIARR